MYAMPALIPVWFSRTRVLQVGTPLSQKLLLFDGLTCSFRSVKLRPRSPGCIACGEHPTLTATTLASYDYTAFTGQAPDDHAPAPLQIIPPAERMTAGSFAQMLGQLDTAPLAASESKHALPHGCSCPTYSGQGRQLERAASVEDVGEARRTPTISKVDAGPVRPVIVDTRPAEQYNIAHLEGNIILMLSPVLLTACVSNRV